MQQQHEAVSVVTREVIKAAPPVTYIGTTLGGVDWPSIVSILTVGFILLQAAYLLWRWRRDWRKRARPARDAE